MCFWLSQPKDGAVLTGLEANMHKSIKSKGNPVRQEYQIINEMQDPIGLGNA
jgi:hypothetical protein